MKQKLLILAILLAIIVIPTYAQKVKKVKGGDRVYYECFVDENKNPYGEGDVTFKYRFEKVGTIHFSDIKYTKEKADLTVNIILGKMVFKGIVTVPHNIQYDQAMQLTFSRGTISLGNEVYEIDDNGFSVNFDSSLDLDNVKYLDLHTPFVQVSDLEILKNSPDSALFNDVKLHLHSIINVKEGTINPRYIETENEEYYRIEQAGQNYLYTTIGPKSYYRVSAKYIGDKEIKIDEEGKIRYNNKEMYITDANTTSGFDAALLLEFKNMFEGLPKKEGAVLMTDDYPHNNGTFIANINEQPIVFPDKYFAINEEVYKEYTPEVKKMIFDLPKKFSSINWVSYNYAKGQYDNQLYTVIYNKIIYHGEDLLSKYQKVKNAKIKAEANKEKMEYEARCRKYGKKYVDVKDNHNIPIVGMPEGLLIEYGVYLQEEGRNYKKYKLAGFRCIVTVTNGRVSRVYTY